MLVSVNKEGGFIQPKTEVGIKIELEDSFGELSAAIIFLISSSSIVLPYNCIGAFQLKCPF